MKSRNSKNPNRTADQSVGRTVTRLLKSSTTTGRQKIAYPKSGKPEIEAMLIEFAPGGQSGWHMHPFPAYVYGLEGTLTIETDDGSRHKCKAGSAVLEVTNTWHNARNMGKKPLKILVVYIGKKGVPNLIRPKRK